MRFRLFPNNLEGVGYYRIVQPYGMLELIAGHQCYWEVEPSADAKSVPLAMEAPVGDIPEQWDADVYVLQGRMEKFWRTGERQGGRVGVTDFGMPEIVDWLHTHGKLVVSEIDDLIVPGKMPLGADRKSVV